MAEWFKDRRLSENDADRRPFATVHDGDRGDNRTGGAGQIKHAGYPAGLKGGTLGGKAAATRKRNAARHTQH